MYAPRIRTPVGIGESFFLLLFWVRSKREKTAPVTMGNTFLRNMLNPANPAETTVQNGELDWIMKQVKALRDLSPEQRAAPYNIKSGIASLRKLVENRDDIVRKDPAIVNCNDRTAPPCFAYRALQRTILDLSAQLTSTLRLARSRAGARREPDSVFDQLENTYEVYITSAAAFANAEKDATTTPEALRSQVTVLSAQGERLAQSLLGFAVGMNEAMPSNDPRQQDQAGCMYHQVIAILDALRVVDRSTSMPPETPDPWAMRPDGQATSWETNSASSSQSTRRSASPPPLSSSSSQAPTWVNDDGTEASTRWKRPFSETTDLRFSYPVPRQPPSAMSDLSDRLRPQVPSVLSLSPSRSPSPSWSRSSSPTLVRRGQGSPIYNDPWQM